MYNSFFIKCKRQYDPFMEQKCERVATKKPKLICITRSLSVSDKARSLSVSDNVTRLERKRERQ